MSISCLIIVISTKKHFNKPLPWQLPFGRHFVEEFIRMTSRAFLVFVPHNLINYAYSTFLVFCLFMGGQYILLSHCSTVTSAWNRSHFLIAMYCIESYKTSKTINEIIVFTNNYFMSTTRYFLDISLNLYFLCPTNAFEKSLSVWTSFYSI